MPGPIRPEPENPASAAMFEARQQAAETAVAQLGNGDFAVQDMAQQPRRIAVGCVIERAARVGLGRNDFMCGIGSHGTSPASRA
ncbi:MAG: hypothetical protein R3D43_12710 [Tepidamorphaceae bacterium]